MKRVVILLAALLFGFGIIEPAQAQVRVVSYDFENHTMRTAFENAVEPQINSGNSALIKVGSPSTIRRAEGAGLALHGGTTAGSAASATTWSVVASDPGTSATTYYQLTINTSGFIGASLSFDLLSGTTSASHPHIGALISTNGGKSYSPLLAGFDPGNHVWITKSINLPAAADHNRNVVIRIYGYVSDGTSDGIITIDNITISATSTIASAATKNILNEHDLFTSVKSEKTGALYSRTNSTVNDAGTTIIPRSGGSTLNSGNLQLTSLRPFSLNAYDASKVRSLRSPAMTKPDGVPSLLADSRISPSTQVSNDSTSAAADDRLNDSNSNTNQTGGTGTTKTTAVIQQGEGTPVVETVTPIKMNKDLRILPYIPYANPGFELPDHRRYPETPGPKAPKLQDPALQKNVPEPNMPAITTTFDGVDLAASGCNCSPPDTNGDVGPGFYIQAVNVRFEIWDKSGTALQAATTFNSLWGTGGTNPCTQGLHQGDPVVFYDSIADRWVLTDFAFGTSGSNTVPPYYECIAVSQTSNPVTGGWFLYAFQHDATNTDWLGDYPKFGLWPDAYYASYNMFCEGNSCTRGSFQGVQLRAYDRSKMLLGQTATSVFFRLTPAQLGSSYSLLPATFRFGAPPNGREEFFAAIDSPASSSTILNTVHMRKFHIDFTTPANSTLTGPTDVTVANFTDAFDSTGNTAIVPQSGTAVKLDTVGDRLFMNLWYQNLSGTESLWATHTINSTGPTAVRWYQFNVNSGTIPATPVQQGTWDGGGDGLYRWMPSLSLDSLGNMAIGYSASNASSFPSIRYNGRLTSDTAGQLGQGESTMIAGTGSQTTASGRWGDYSAMTIDPTDSCSLWFTSEYLTATGSNWRTRVGTFRYPGCAAAQDGTLTGTVTDSSNGNPISGATVTAGGSNTTTNASGVYTFNILPGTYNMTATKIGYTTASANGIVVTLGNTTTQNFSITPSCTTVSRTWKGAGTSGGTGGTDFNTATNWNPNGVPQPCDNLTMNLTSQGLITLSSSITVGSITGTLNAIGAVFRLDPQGNTLTVAGTTSVDVTGGDNTTQLQLGTPSGSTSAGKMIFQGNVTLGTSNIAFTSVLLQGNSNSSFVFQGNLTLGPKAGTASALIPGSYTFDGSGTQTLTINNSAFFFDFSTLVIGSANNPTVTLAGTLNNARVSADLTVNGSSILDLTTHTLNRSAIGGGTLTLNANSTMKLAASTGGQGSSNFPSNFNTYTLSANSTVEYNAAGGTDQTIFATPNYGNLTLSRVSGATATTKTAGNILTVVNNLTIGTGATFAASTFTHNIGGNWVNNGTFTANTSTINFNTAGSKTVSGSSTTGFNNITVNKGTDATNVLDVQSTITLSGATNPLVITNGTFKLSSASTITPFTSTGGATIPTTGGFWLNGGTINAGGFSWTVNGLLRVSAGTLNVGNSTGNALLGSSNTTFTMEGGVVNVAGRLLNSGGTATISGGTINICTVGLNTGGNASFEMTATSNLTMSNGTIVFQNPNAGAGGDLKITSGTGTKSITGGTFQIGNASTPAGQVFKINSAIPVFNLTINATNSPTGQLDTSLTVNNAVTISGGTLDVVGLTLTLNGSISGSTLSAASGTVIYNQSANGQGILAANYGALQFNNFNKTLASSGTIGVALSFSPGTATGHTITGSTIDFNGSGSETIPAFNYNNLSSSNSGNRTFASGGTIKIAGTFTPGTNVYTVTGSTVEFNGTSAQSMPSSRSFTYNNLTINNSAGVTVGTVVAGTTTVNGTLALTLGALTNGASNNITFSNGATIIRSGGSLAAAPIFSGNANVQYTGSSALTTGPELPTSSSVLNDLTINNNGAGVTLNASATVNGTLALTSGDLTTGPNFLTEKGASTGTGDVITAFADNGGVIRTDLGATAKAFGNPFVTIAITAGDVPTQIMVKLLKGSTPTDFANSVRRQYTLTPTFTPTTPVFTATVRLHYLDTELNNNAEGSLQLWRRDSTLNQWVSLVSTGDTTQNYVESSAVAAFSPWTIAASAPTDVALMNFNALSDEQGNVLLQWQTSYEVSNLGFNVYRDQGGQREKLNPTILAGSVLLSGRTIITAGLNYVWMDKLASAKDYAQYWIEDVDLSGKTTMFGPVSAVPVTKLPDRAQSLMLSQLHTNATSTDTQRFLRPTIASSGKATPAKPAVLDLQAQWDIAAKPGVKLMVRKAGWYRVTQPELVAAGFDVTKDPRNLQLFSDAREVPIQVNGGLKGRLEPSDSIEFYGQALDTPSTNLRTYYLLNGAQPGRRVAVLPFSKGDESRRPSFTSTVERRDRFLYFPSLNNGEAENWFGAVIYSTPFNQSLTLRQVDADATTDAILEVALQGLGSSSPPVNHIVRVQVNGQEAGSMVFDGQLHQVSQFSISQRLLQEGANTVTLTASGGSSDFSIVDWLKLSYAHRFVADENRLLFTATTGEAVRVSGFTTPVVRVFDLTDEANPTELKGDVELQDKLYRLTVVAQAGGERVLLAVSDNALERAAQVTPQVPSSWHVASQGADVVMITHGSLRSALEPLLQVRKQQGYAVAVVDVEDVYDEYSYGQHSAQAIQDFLAAARNWKRTPRFVLLVGDASYDMKNYLGLGENDLVPTKVVWTNTFETASDDWLADMNRDGVPEMAVGRLPVRTPEEATRMISKIIGYNNSQTDGALLVADRNDGFNFETASNTVQSLLPAGMTVRLVFRAQMDDATASRTIIDAINRGPKLVNYAGHGSSSVWRGNLLTNDSVGLLTNQQALPVVVSMTCLNNLFNDPRVNSLGETLLLSAQGGAIAVWASSAQTTAGGQAVLNQEFIRQLFQGSGAKGQPLTLGEAAARAKAAVGDIDIRKSWILLGDPMMVIR